MLQRRSIGSSSTTVTLRLSVYQITTTASCLKLLQVVEDCKKLKENGTRNKAIETWRKYVRMTGPGLILTEMVATGIITIWKNVVHMVKALFKLAVLVVAVSTTIQLRKVTLQLTKEKIRHR